MVEGNLQMYSIYLTEHLETKGKHAWIVTAFNQA